MRLVRITHYARHQASGSAQPVLQEYCKLDLYYQIILSLLYLHLKHLDLQTQKHFMNDGRVRVSRWERRWCLPAC